jgi:hypothetical protein
LLELERDRDDSHCKSVCKRILLLLGLAWLIWLVVSLVRLCRATGRDPKHQHGDGTVPPWAYRQPDPLIYSQQYLQAQGLAVTWHNPDIHLERASVPGVEVDSSKLDPDTEYIVVARIWNGSTTAAAVDMPADGRSVGQRRIGVSGLCTYPMAHPARCRSLLSPGRADLG